MLGVGPHLQNPSSPEYLNGKIFKIPISPKYLFEKWGAGGGVAWGYASVWVFDCLWNAYKTLRVHDCWWKSVEVWVCVCGIYKHVWNVMWVEVCVRWEWVNRGWNSYTGVLYAPCGPGLGDVTITWAQCCFVSFTSVPEHTNLWRVITCFLLM